VAATINLDYLLNVKTSMDKASVPPKFPSVSRDLALVLNKKVSYEEIKNEIKKTDKLVENVEAFDVYQGDKIDMGKKSLAITISMRDKEKTLTDAEVNVVINKVISVLKMKFLAEVRS